METAQDKPRSGLFNTGYAFFDEATLSGGLYYFQRNRKRFSAERDAWGRNLDHASAQAALSFDSGLAYGLVGLELGVYASKDLRNKGSVDHEMNFFPWDDPWHADWGKNNTRGGGNIYKAALKLEHEDFWAKLGYFQPKGPGVLGVNWSILPGTYQGGEAGFKLGDFEFAAAVANAYKAPWFKEFYSLQEGSTSDGGRVDYLWSLGSRYHFTPDISLELAYGESEGYLKNAHLKLNSAHDVGSGKLKANYHLYLMADSDDDGDGADQFDGLAYQHFLGLHYSTGQWKFKAEYTYSRAAQSEDSHLGYFAYRLTVPSGSSKGAYDVWWDARSDWNHDGESAAFIGISRSFADISLGGVSLEGFSLGAGFAIGWDGKAKGYARHLKEYAWTADIAYSWPGEFLNGATLSLHFTRYYNDSGLKSWEGFKNAFEDEKDIKLLLAIPF